jgi:short-subunit dehydrogenase
MHLDTMAGKTVVITGATSGIGQVAAETLAKMGARIVLVARDKSRADATLARLRSSAPIRYILPTSHAWSR